MKLASTQNRVETGSTLGRQNFTMSMNAKMAAGLSDMLYQNKIGSIVREISCNAMDSHIAAGTPDLPIEIHVPNVLEPWVSFKDYGVGMDHNTMYEVYTAYGESTKDQSNDMVGAFGLGSKTPFSYRDQFTVTSIHDGVKRIYSAAKGEDGIPCLIQQLEIETNEPSGVEVTLSVDQQDFNEFRREIVNQLKFFKVVPRIVNDDNIMFPNMDESIEFERDGFCIYKNYDVVHRMGLVVVQGGVGYPLDVNSLFGDMVSLSTDDIRIKDFSNILGQKPTLMFFNIGEISVTLSREGISYDERTRNNLIERIREIATALSNDIYTEVMSLDNEWDRVIYLNKLDNVSRHAIISHKDYSNILKTAQNHTSFFGSKAHHGFPIKTYIENSSVFNDYPEIKEYTLRENNAIGFNQTVTMENIRPIENMAVFVRDTRSKPLARLRNHVKMNGIKKSIVFEHDDAKFTGGEVKALSRGLGGVPVTRISELAVPARIPKQDTYKSTAWKYNHYRNNNDRALYSGRWDCVYKVVSKLAEDEPTIFVEVHNHEFCLDTTVLEKDNVESAKKRPTAEQCKIILNARQFNKINYPIYAVNRETAKRIRKGKIDGEWLEVTDVYQSLAKELDKAIKLYKQYYYNRNLSSALYMCANNLIVHILSEDVYPLERKDGKMYRAWRMYKATQRRAERTRKNHDTEFKWVGDMAESDNDTLLKAKEVIDEVFEAYPLIRYIKRNYDKDWEKYVYDYLNERDRQG